MPEGLRRDLSYEALAVARARVATFSDLAALDKPVAARLLAAAENGDGLQRKLLLQKFPRALRGTAPAFGEPLEVWRAWAKNTRRAQHKREAQQKALLLAKFAALGATATAPTWNAPLEEWRAWCATTRKNLRSWC